VLNQPNDTNTGMHHHITRDQRVALAALLRAGHTKAETARQLRVNRSSISRELRRNRRAHGYHATHADVLARARRQVSKRRYRRIENDAALAADIESILDPLVSPECVAHELGLAHATVYAWLYRSRPDLLARLPQRGRKRRRYGTKRAQKQGWTRRVRSIEERPETDESWEGDTVVGATRSRLLTHVHRTSLYLVADLIPNGAAETVAATLKERTELRGATFTFDRGSEFALWQLIERNLNARVYFAHAHSPWERGKNENTNGRLRRVFPKRFDFATITKRDLSRTVHFMNHTKRKSLSWRTPCAVWGRCCVSG